MRSNIIEVTIETPTDGNVYFRPLGKPLRGRKDFSRQALFLPDAMRFAREFSRGIPGTLLRVDLEEETVTLIEPLRTAEYASEREQLESRRIPIPHDVEILSPHIPDWLHEISRCVDSGVAKIVKGELPKDLGEESERKREPSPEERNVDRIDRLCDLVEKLIQHNASSGK